MAIKDLNEKLNILIGDNKSNWKSKAKKRLANKSCPKRLFKTKYKMEEQKEIWKEIKDYEGIYEVSSFGRVKSLKLARERILKCSVSNRGYRMAALCKDGVRKTKTVHQLVAVAFLKHTPCGHKWVVNHIDFNRLNNNASNLEIVTARENCNKKHIKSTSEYVGVSWYKASRKWRACIEINKKREHLGLFKTELEASVEYQRVLAGGEIKRVASTSSYRGVSLKKSSKRWVARITINKKEKHLGVFKTELEAHEEYQKALKTK